MLVASFVILLVIGGGPPLSLSPVCPQDEREARETVKREQDEAYRVSLEADRKKVFCFFHKQNKTQVSAREILSTTLTFVILCDL